MIDGAIPPLGQLADHTVANYYMLNAGWLSCQEHLLTV